MFYEDLPTRPSRTNTKKRCPFHHRGLECKSRKSTDTWSNRQVWPWSIKWSRAKANRVLPRERTGHSKKPLPTTQETTDITRWSIPKSDWFYSLQLKMEKLYTVRKKQDQELIVIQIMSHLLQNSDLHWRTWGKPLDHSGMTWIKSLVIIQWKWQTESRDSDRVPEELWTEVCNIVQETVIKSIPKKKNCNKAKWLSEEALQKRWEKKGKEKRKDILI